MLVSFEWIREFADIRMSAREAAHALTMAGLEVEGIERAGRDYVLEVNVTPDRPDCLSLMGIARELAAISGGKARLPAHRVGKAGRSSFRIEILQSELCRRYAGRVVRGVRIGPSPGWIKERLEKCGIRSINNAVDITNYVLMELGHPLHAFDLGTLRGAVIRVGTAGKGKTFTTLDGVTRKLPGNALLIWDAERPVAIAGVMGGAETEVTGSTTDIFIESAYFDPLSVRKTSKALGLRSEASYRFERGTDIVMLERALDRAALLVLELAGGEAEELVDAYPVKFKPKSITVRYDRVNRVLGTEIPRREITGILKRLDLKIMTAGDSFTVTPPSDRHDLVMEADITEEVARLYGYGRIPTVVPRAEISCAESPARRRLVARAKEAVQEEGFNEAVNYSFMNTEHLDMLGIAQGDPRRRCVEIKNPLRKEDSHLRTTLLPSLIENLKYNFARGVREIRLFEAARVFEARGKRLPHEPLRLGGIRMKAGGPSLYREEAGGFYLIKGAVEAVLDGLRINGCSFTPSAEPFLHPGKSADLNVSGRRAGCLGVLSPAVAERLDIKAKQDILVFELDLDALMNAVPEGITYRPIPRFPAIERDIAILLEEGITSAEVTGLVSDYPSEYIEGVSVFDSYRGRGIPDGKKSLGINVLYRSAERTLTDEEVEGIHTALVGHLLEKTGGELRG
jgi:phenylalanyl-tRNA synthetase beta chain